MKNEPGPAISVEQQEKDKSMINEYFACLFPAINILQIAEIGIEQSSVP